MKHLFYGSVFTLLSTLFDFQTLKAQTAINLGEIFHESLKFSSSGNSDATLKIPCDSFLVLYRYRGNNWLTDTKDSIECVEAIVQKLQLSSTVFKKLIVVCYSYNRDRFLNTNNRPAFKPSSSYRLRNYYLNDKNPPRLLRSGKVVLINKRGKVLAYSTYVGDFKYTHKEEPRRFKAKLLTEKNGLKVPVTEALVILPSDKSTDTVAIARTNKYGDFELSLPEAMEEGSIRVTPTDKTIEEIIVATQEGVERSRIVKKEDAFEYRFIEEDIYRLSDMEVEEELSLGFDVFLKTNEKEYRQTEFINYDVGSYKIENGSKLALDKIARRMTDNPNLQLQVTSHTDSQGEDQANIELSEKRSLGVVSYLILIGVHKDRMTYVGKGETEIRNRCTNGVDCSSIEHAYNRRTEFKYTKN